MAEEIDDGEFYRENFSADSDWEVFNAQLGEILQKWDVANVDAGRPLAENELFSCNWRIVSEKLELLKKNIAIDYYQAILKPLDDNKNDGVVQASDENTSYFFTDLMSLRNNFGPPINKRNSSELHTLARIYGLRRFIVIYPLERYFTKTEEFDFFLSASAVVAAEVGSAVPIFVQIYDPKWNFFVGIGLAPALRTNFNLVGLEQAPLECRYLSGLLELFKEKMPRSYKQPATVSVRTTYAMNTMRIRIPMHVPFTNGANTEDYAISGQVAKLATNHFHALPQGFFPNSCTEWYAVYTWPKLSEHIALDSSMRTDFIPTKAHYGHMYLSVQATSYLSSCLRDYQKLAMAEETLEFYVGRNFSGTSSGAESPVNPLDQLTQTKLPHLGSIATPRPEHRDIDLSSLSNLTKKLPGPMNEYELNQMLAYLFPDLHQDIALFPYTKDNSKHKFDPMRIKTAVPDSLVCRLGCLLATCNAHFGGQSGMAQLWAGFTRELRFLWDNSLTVPGIASSFPDTRTCLLHQKLQMLNICVERSLYHHAVGKEELSNSPITTSNKTERTPSPPTSSSEGNDADDEFYECDNDEQMAQMTLADVSMNASSSSLSSKSPHKPEGRDKRLGDERLLNHKDEYLYIPITQEPVPKTEDQLQNDAEVMLKLGPGSGLTTQMMCSSLLSDMEAFKAANPKATMSDFIRWYSPKDWESKEDDDGNITVQMSARMLAPGNTWQLVWEQAQPVPVARQKRLFDDTNEALKVLHYMDTRNMSEIYGLTVLPAIHSAILMLVDIFSNAKVESVFAPQIESLLSDLCRVSREVAVNELPNVQGILQRLEKLENQFYQYQCFKSNFNDSSASNSDLNSQLEQFLTEQQVNSGGDGVKNAIVGGTGARLTELLEQKFGSLNMEEHLISKDYIIRVDGDTTSAAKEAYMGPQFLRAIVTGDKIRLCGAFTESTNLI